MESADNVPNKGGSIQGHTPKRPRSQSMLDLPPEVRLEVFKFAIEDSFENRKETLNSPSLLSALSDLSETRPLAEAQEVHDILFRSIDHTNEEAFKKEKWSERLKIKHLEIVAPVNFKAQTMLLVNNIEVLTLNYSGEAVAEGQTTKIWYDLGICPRELAKQLIRASRQVKMVVFKRRKCVMMPSEADQEDLVDNFSQAMGMEFSEKGVLERGVVYWVWEAEKGSVLTWTDERWRR